MKIRAIRLENVRRFVDSVQIGGIGDGLNVLTTPNERGKSTFFDALHAVFFKSRRSWDKEIRSLVPYAGGDPSVMVEIELPEGIFRIEKRWNKRRSGDARIISSSRLIKQADDAEAWITETLKSPKDGGPSGLLWVRQGQSNLDDGKGSHHARRDLLTSVAGEVEAMTGGRRMDMARDACQKDLERYLTKTGRPKAHGPLKRRKDEVVALRGKHANLQTKSDDLRRELNRRRELKRVLVELEDPEEEAIRKSRVTEAETAHAEASRHQEKLERALEGEHAKRIELDHVAEKLEVLKRNLSEVTEANAAHVAAKERHEDAIARQRAMESTMLEVAKAYEEARQRAETADAGLRMSIRSEASNSAAERRKELNGRLGTAEQLRQQAEKALADARVEISHSMLAKIETLDENLRVLKRTRDMEAASITMEYTSGRQDGIALDGSPLAGGERITIPDGARLQIENLGWLTIHPGRKAAGESLIEAEEELTAALVAAGVKSVEAARESMQRRREAEERERDAKVALGGTAPDGIDALREQLAGVPESTGSQEDLPTVAEAQETQVNATTALAESSQRLEAARTEFGIADTKAAHAAAALESAEGRCARAEAQLGGIRDPETERKSLGRALLRLGAALEEATRNHEVIAENAPDLDAARVTLDRARSIMRRVEEDRQRFRLELGKLNTTIEIRVGEAVEEELSDVAIRLEAAERALSELNFEIAVLRTLGEALECAHESARDRYLQPVLVEFRPLVHLLWPEAKLRFDADEVLPSSLERAGMEEDFEVLSGGTQEQIALLVRLAFARMLSKGGTPSPVILDDAIVYTDDDRIERVFDALTRQARDLQIIVLSCRQKAFRDLGGRSLEIVPVGSKN